MRVDLDSETEDRFKWKKGDKPTLYGWKNLAAKERLIRRERTKLRRLFKDMGKDRLSAAEKLIDQAAFMAVTLADLADQINANGCTSEYQNGENQWGTKKSPEVEVHTSMMQRYLSTIKQLTDLLPEPPKAPAGPALPPWVSTDGRP